MHQAHVTVYYEDVDAMGIVYHANYLRFFDRARLQWVHSLGYPMHALQQAGILLVVKKIDVSYHRPAKLGDELVIFTRLVQLKRASFVVEQEMQCIAEPAITLCSGRIQVVSTSIDLKPMAVPSYFVSALNSNRSPCMTEN